MPDLRGRFIEIVLLYAWLIIAAGVAAKSAVHDALDHRYIFSFMTSLSCAGHECLRELEHIAPGPSAAPNLQDIPASHCSASMASRKPRF